MADDFTTPAGIKAVLDDTLDYDIESDATKANRRLKALRAKKQEALSSASRGSSSYSFDLAQLEKDIQEVMTWINANTTPTDAQRNANPSVTHADFSTFGQYR